MQKLTKGTVFSGLIITLGLMTTPGDDVTDPDEGKLVMLQVIEGEIEFNSSCDLSIIGLSLYITGMEKTTFIRGRGLGPVLIME